MPRRHRKILTLATVSVMAFTAACGSDDGSPGAQAATPGGTSDDADDADDIPTGITLQIGDQGQIIETVLRSSGELDDLPYDVEFKTFLSGPLLVQGFEAGEIDVGMLGDTPAANAVPAGVPVKALLTAESTGAGSSLLARPGIESIEDLRGQRVAFTTGTAQHAFALRVLREAGLTQDDVVQVDVALQQLGAVLDGGSADASVVGAGDVLRYLADNSDATVLATGAEVEPVAYLYLLASHDVLDDPERSLAVYDLAARIAQSWEWAVANPEEFIEAYYVGVNRQDPEFAASLYEYGGHFRWYPLGDDVREATQEMVGLLADANAIDAEFDVGPLFDPDVIARSNAAVEERIDR